jgi:phage tail sheath gpL-like
MSIGFDQIALTINTPGVYVEFDNSRAVQGVQIQPHDVLICGQKLSTGSATAGQIYSVGSASDAISLFGATSQLAQMIAAYKAIDPLTPVYACSSAADAGTNASGSITWTGTATEDGELVLYIGGRRVVVAVADGDTAADVETAALAALALETDLPVTAAGDSGSGVDLTAVQDGTIGNQIMLGVCLLEGEHVPAGLTVTVTAMASGATDPSYSGIITAMGEDQYHTIVVGLANDTVLDLFEAELESRWGPMRAIEGVVFGAYYDTRANLTTAGNARNSLTSVLVGCEKSALLDLPWEVAAQTAAINAKQTQVDPSRACTGLSFSGVSAPARGSRFTRAERDILLSDGVSTTKAGSDGRLLVERLITTWQTNSNGIADVSYKDLTTVRLLAALRYSVRARISSKYGRFKLMDDGNPIPAGQPIVNPSILKAEMIVLFQEWQDLGWVEDLDQFKSELVVERDGSDPNRVNMILPPNLINNLLVTAAKISFLR